MGKHCVSRMQSARRDTVRFSSSLADVVDAFRRAYIFYRHGHTLRERSAYAAGQAEQEKKDAEED